jgi:diaminopimelate epimerase
VIAPESLPDGRVRVDMGAPRVKPEQVPFLPEAMGLEPLSYRSEMDEDLYVLNHQGMLIEWAAISMGNPHAVIVVDSVNVSLAGGDSAYDRVDQWGPFIQSLAAFPQGVNVGFMQVLSRTELALRVYERGAGETLACGSGACAAVVSGIRRGLLNTIVSVSTRGGPLQIEWSGRLTDPVYLSGDAKVVFSGEIDIPSL